jgi:hypothetical protein
MTEGDRKNLQRTLDKLKEIGGLTNEERSELFRIEVSKRGSPTTQETEEFLRDRDMPHRASRSQWYHPC